jgi:glycosyltransferase involved in cell wall biosynthesis
MLRILEICFWAGSFISLYSYAVYPLILLVLRRRRRSPLPLQPGAFSVTVIIAARNEERRIADKLANTLALEYPPGLLSILVASDASSDATDAIVRNHRDLSVQLIRSQERRGKEHAQSLAVAAATGSILVFTDVATRLRPDALLRLVENFSDPTIGAVSSEDELHSPAGEVRGEGAYVKYEMWLRSLESDVAGIVGLSGSCFAVRREVCGAWRTDIPSDLSVALLCSLAGMRSVADSRVKGSYQDLKDDSQEFARKKRTIIRGMTAVWKLRAAANPARSGLFAFQVWSHKVLRWIVPLGMLFALSAGALLARSSSLYEILFITQVGIYAAAILGYASASARRFAPIRIALYFVVANLATAAAAWDFIKGVRVATWEPSQR